MPRRARRAPKDRRRRRTRASPEANATERRCRYLPSLIGTLECGQQEERRAKGPNEAGDQQCGDNSENEKDPMRVWVGAAGILVVDFGEKGCRVVRGWHRVWFRAVILQQGRDAYRPRTLSSLSKAISALDNRLRSHASPHAFASKTSHTTTSFSQPSTV